MSGQRPARGRCEYVMPWGEDCGTWSPMAVSVRHGDCCPWQSWAVCAEHEDGLRADLRGMYYVTALYRYGDQRARRAAERAA